MGLDPQTGGDVDIYSWTLYARRRCTYKDRPTVKTRAIPDIENMVGVTQEQLRFIKGILGNVFRI